MNTVPGVNTRFYVLPLVRSETGVLPLPLIFFLLQVQQPEIAGEGEEWMAHCLEHFLI